jgi:hypothetical protein
MTYLAVLGMAALLAGANPGLLQAPVQDDGAETADIVVIGFSKPYKLSVEELRDAVVAYRQGRPVLAPASTLYFAVDGLAGQSLDGLRLVLRSSGSTIPIALDDNRRFVLPDLGAGKWELVANRGRTGLSIRPIVLSPGTDVGDRRLGDMRLQCSVLWSIEKHHASLPMKAIFGAAGGCRSTKLALYTKSDRPIAEAFVLTDGKRIPVSVLSDRRTYRAPLGDKSLHDEARVRFTFS